MDHPWTRIDVFGNYSIVYLGGLWQAISNGIIIEVIDNVVSQETVSSVINDFRGYFGENVVITIMKSRANNKPMMMYSHFDKEIVWKRKFGSLSLYGMKYYNNIIYGGYADGFKITINLGTTSASRNNIKFVLSSKATEKLSTDLLWKVYSLLKEKYHKTYYIPAEDLKRCDCVAGAMNSSGEKIIVEWGDLLD